MKNLEQLKIDYEQVKLKNYTLDITRGKPDKNQLDLSNGILTVLNENEHTDNYLVDCRNYGEVFGLKDMCKIFSDILEVPTQNVITCGNSSLNLMFDLLNSFLLKGVRGQTPWIKQDKIKFLCPSPGYDRHFAICEYLDIEMIPIKILEDGPCMDTIENLISNDDTIKGVWCVPKYSNPEGVVFSDNVIKRFANLKPKAKDFVVMWDNAYALHALYENETKLLSIFDECKKTNNENLLYMFASFSKISFGGAGVTCISASDENLSYIKKRLNVQNIGYDKINQLRHVKFFKDVNGVKNHLKKHADILRPKFELAYDIFDKHFKDKNICRWTKPEGGYFISFYSKPGCAKKIIKYCADCGLTLVKAGAAYPYGDDKEDSHIRIAPSFPSLDDLEKSLEIFCLCVKIATLETLEETLN